ncbi:MAG: hypothetical protein KF764_22190 [Labilithrix sp.]|nr:hypothetical protein [Labilithrix sp.]
MNSVARSLLPLLFGLTSLAMSACADPTTSGDASDEPTAGEAADADATIATTLSGDVGYANARELPKVDSVNSATAPRLELFDPATGDAFEVLSYEFGIENAISARQAMTGAGAAKARLKPLKIAVRHVKARSSPFLQQLLIGKPIDKLVLRQVDPKQVKGAGTEIASFHLAFVTSMQTDVEGGSVESYEIATAKVVLPLAGGKGADTVSHDQTTNSTAGSAFCGAATPTLGPFVQSDPGWPLAKGSVRIDRAEVKVANAIDIGNKTGGAGAATPVLEKFLVEGPMNATGVCALFYSGASLMTPTVRVDAASMDTKSAKPQVNLTWEACYAAVVDVTFKGRAAEEPRQILTLDAGGVIRTDRGASETTSGWSFATKASMTSCSNMLD